MNSQSLLQNALWITPVILQVAIAGVMLQRRLFREYSFFFAYCLYIPARDVLLFLLRHNLNAYAWVYWIGEGLSIGLQFLTVMEVGRRLVSRYPALQTLGLRIFQSSVAVFLAFAVLLFINSMQGRYQPSVELILIAERSARVLQVCVLIAMMAFISRIGLLWDRYAIGILLGSGVAGLQLVAFELRGSLHAISDASFMLLAPAVYDGAVILWAVYFLWLRPPAATVSRHARTDLPQWDQLLRRYLARL